MAVGKATFRRSHGRSVHVTLTATVEAEELVYVDGFLGRTVEAGGATDVIALELDMMEIDVEIPAAVYSSAAKGSVIYFVAAEVTGHSLDDAAYTLTATGNTRFLKVTELLGNNTVSALFLGGREA